MNGDGLTGRGATGRRGDRIGPRGGERGDPTFTADARVTKSFRLQQRSKVKLIAEVFNLFNTANFGSNFQERVDSTGFGEPLSIATNPRQAQLALRYEF